MGLFGSKKENVFYILDIGSSSVGGSVVSIQKNGNPKTLFQTRKEVPFQEELNFKRFLSGTVKNISNVLAELKKISNKKPKATHIFLSSPWFAAQNRTVIFKQGENFRVTQELVQEIVSEEVQSFKNKTAGKSENKMVTLESNIIDFAINGYETAKPYGKYAKELKITFFISISTEKVFESFREAVIAGTHDDNILFHTFLFSAFSSLSEISVTPDNFVFIDINGEMTDIMTVRNGLLVETTSFPFGRNFVKRKIMEKMKIPESSIYPTIDLYNRDRIENSLKLKITGAIKDIGQEWVNKLSESFEISSSEYLIPSHFYILTNFVLEPIFMNLLKSDKLNKFLSPEQNLYITPITPQILGSKIDGQPKGSMDVFMLFEALFLQKLFDVQ